MYYVYILECSDQSFYTGHTSNLYQRLTDHNSGKHISSYTFKRRPVILKWFESYTDPSQAIKVERQLKGWSRRKKAALIEEDWEKVVAFSKNHTRFGKVNE